MGVISLWTLGPGGELPNMFEKEGESLLGVGARVAFLTNVLDSPGCAGAPFQRSSCWNVRGQFDLFDLIFTTLIS